MFKNVLRCRWATPLNRFLSENVVSVWKKNVAQNSSVLKYLLDALPNRLFSLALVEYTYITPIYYVRVKFLLFNKLEQDKFVAISEIISATDKTVAVEKFTHFILALYTQLAPYSGDQCC